MTTAKVYLLYDRHIEKEEIVCQRFAILNQTISLQYVDPGDKDKGRPAGKVPDVRTWMLYRRKIHSGQRLDSKLSGDELTLRGAECSIEDWRSYSRTRPQSEELPSWAASISVKSSQL
jgi:hypothetical protein